MHHYGKVKGYKQGYGKVAHDILPFSIDNKRHKQYKQCTDRPVLHLCKVIYNRAHKEPAAYNAAYSFGIFAKCHIYFCVAIFDIGYAFKSACIACYAADKKKFVYKPMRSLFDDFEDWSEPQFDATKDFYHGRIYTLEQADLDKVDYPLKALNRWEYLDGDGDFRSAEVKKLRDEADVIITNPPFSMFREFLAWIMEAGKQFLIIGNINCITYKEVFPLIMQNKIWLGNGMGRWISGFLVPKDYELYGTEARLDKEGNRIVATNQCLWLTNLEHGRRHKPLMLMNYADCELAHPKVKGVGFQRYDNYDAIEVPATDAIPSDYKGVMGVPITFLDKYCPEQFEIIGHPHGDYGLELGLKPYPRELKELNKGLRDGDLYYMKDGKPELPYRRILIRKKQL